MKIMILLTFLFTCMHLQCSLVDCCLASLCTMHRADSKQARGHTIIKTPTEMHIWNALKTYVNASKT